jgi:formiminotetrahydrofolate cyclodeaminase
MENNNNYELEILNGKYGLGLYIVNKEKNIQSLVLNLEITSWDITPESSHQNVYINLKELAENYLIKKTQKNKIEEITKQHEEKCMVNQNVLSEIYGL